jgi:hypothetical protein
LQQGKRCPRRAFHGRQGAKGWQRFRRKKAETIHLQGREIRRRVLRLRGQAGTDAPEAPIAVPISAEKGRMIRRRHAVIRVHNHAACRVFDMRLGVKRQKPIPSRRTIPAGPRQRAIATTALRHTPHDEHGNPARTIRQHQVLHRAGDILGRRAGFLNVARAIQAQQAAR